MTEQSLPPHRCLTPEETEALLRGDLSTTREADWLAHLQQCARCRDELSCRREENELLRHLRSAHQRRAAGSASEAGHWRDTTTETPVRIDGFEIVEELHRGGQGVVYKARQHSPNRLVALKLLRDDTDTSIRERVRFEREIELAASLRHPNIVTVYETGTSGTRQYFAMEYVDGQPLDDYILHHELSVRQKVRLLLKTCGAVQSAHQRGVIHRDLKPGNVLVDGEGEPRVLDFGIAKPAGGQPSVDQNITLAGEFLGTVAYSAPEQAAGDPRRVDVRCDVYSLGVLGYEMLTGRLPYDLPNDLAESIQCIREAPPIPPSRVHAGIDDDLETILLTALAKDVERRYSSAEALYRDLGHYLNGEPIEAKRDSVWYVLGKHARRHRLVVGVVAGAFVLLTAFAVTMAVLYHRAEQAAYRAQRTQRFLQSTLSSVNAWSLGPDATLFQVLADRERSMHAELVNQPDTEAELRYTIGLTYASVRHDEAARRQLQAAYDFYAGEPGDHSEQVAVCLANLGRIEGNVAHLRRAVRLLRETHGDDSSETILCRVDLAAALVATGVSGFGEAEAILAEATNRLQARYGTKHRYVSRALHLRGWLRTRQGQPAAAEALFRRALSLYLEQETPDPYAPELFEHYTQLLTDLGRYSEADALLEQASRVLPPVFGRDWLPKLQWRRGRLHSRMGRHDTAESFYRHTLAIRCLYAADLRPHAAKTLQLLASRLFGPASNDEAELYGEAIRVMWREHAADAAVLGACACDLAELHMVRGQTAAAISLLRSAQILCDEDPLVDQADAARVRDLLEKASESETAGQAATKPEAEDGTAVRTTNARSAAALPAMEAQQRSPKGSD